ncbi:ABC transporter permease [Planctomicrobium piriforme]|uniref:Putative ABC transport system permease protein n=1 Tax=Planctomicrobium piriforme TaxID=1576369 RepID=A0A1I3RBH1_9PLAN|nr:ABC transporter permease [Planctomicrobium piriforme]SFJ43410.1 putative ABC transport system permease protein [Planctomicrobium piriforme]
MFRFVPYVFKSLWGHRARTLLTVSGAAVAMFVFCFVGSVQEGLDRLTSDEDAQRTLIVFQENRFCPTSSRLPEDYARRIAVIPGVKNVMPIQVWTNNCRASLDVVVFNGANPKQLRESRKLTLVSGNWNQFESQRDAAILGRNVAQRRRLAVGDQFSIGDLNVQVAGIFSSPVPAEENLIYTSLAFLQYTRGLDAAGLVTQHEVHLTENADPEDVASTIDEALKAGPVATTTRRKGAFQTSTLSDLVDLIGFAHWLGYASVGLVLALVGTTTVMSVQDRVKEHAVLQTLGVRPGRVFRIVMTESLVQCTLGGLLGMVTAMGLLAWSGLAVGAEGVTIAFRPSWVLAVSAVWISLLVGVLAGVFPAMHASRIRIVEAMRQA